MDNYTAKDTLRIAKRFNNNKRTYLLVNPLQAKHMPVSPTESLTMMRTLGKKLAAKYPDTKLVIGFAETATAIGAVVAESFSPDCVYAHTTRENVSSVMEWVLFQEEHSHATEQKIIGDYMGEWIAGTDTIIFVDDEISTGKTLINMIEQLHEKFTQMGTKKVVAASLLNRVSMENERQLEDRGIICEYLVKLPQSDYSVDVEQIIIHEAANAEPIELKANYHALFCGNFHDPRRGIRIGSYKRSCEDVAETFAAQFAYNISQYSSILVLGTEECMYPALRLGEVLEQSGRNYTVRCHATTRSPIGISSQKGYPISSGCKLQSFFEDNRDTYIYNLDLYDTVIVVTDTTLKGFKALESFAGALPNIKECQLYYLQGGRNVWCAQPK